MEVHHHVRRVQRERMEIELQLLQLKHEHVKHVKNDIIVDDELRRMLVLMVHIDELLDEKR